MENSVLLCTMKPQEVEAGVAARDPFLRALELKTDLNFEAPSSIWPMVNPSDMFQSIYSLQSMEASRRKTSLRKGKWTTEEERYTNKIIEAFNEGTLVLSGESTGTTLRAYLADKLQCDPMRITKKYTGALCLGKRVYHGEASNKVSAEKLSAVKAELDELEAKFREKMETLPPLQPASFGGPGTGYAFSDSSSISSQSSQEKGTTGCVDGAFGALTEATRNEMMSDPYLSNVLDVRSTAGAASSTTAAASTAKGSAAPRSPSSTNSNSYVATMTGPEKVPTFTDSMMISSPAIDAFMLRGEAGVGTAPSEQQRTLPLQAVVPPSKADGIATAAVRQIPPPLPAKPSPFPASTEKPSSPTCLFEKAEPQPGSFGARGPFSQLPPWIAAILLDKAVFKNYVAYHVQNDQLQVSDLLRTLRCEKPELTEIPVDNDAMLSPQHLTSLLSNPAGNTNFSNYMARYLISQTACSQMPDCRVVNPWFPSDSLDVGASCQPKRRRLDDGSAQSLSLESEQYRLFRFQQQKQQQQQQQQQQKQQQQQQQQQYVQKLQNQSSFDNAKLSFDVIRPQLGQSLSYLTAPNLDIPPGVPYRHPFFPSLPPPAGRLTSTGVGNTNDEDRVAANTLLGLGKR